MRTIRSPVALAAGFLAGLVLSEVIGTLASCSSPAPSGSSTSRCIWQSRRSAFVVDRLFRRRSS
jgi:hypothetical protein